MIPDLVGGGAETLVRHLAAGYRNAGLEVSVMFWRDGGPWPAGEERVRQLARALPFPGSLRAHLKSFQPAVVHSHTPWAGLHAGVEGLGLGARFVHTVHVRPSNLPPHLRLAESIAMHLADIAVCVSDAWVSEVKAKKTVAIGNGTPPSLQRAEPAEEFLWIGRFVERKDPGFFVQALQHLPHLKGALVGRGPLLVELQSQVSQTPNVRLMGWADDPQLLMARSAAVVFTAKFEGQPMVALEAMSIGVPLVVPDLPEFTCLLPPDYPFVYAAGDVEDLRRKLRAVASDQQVARRAGEALRLRHLEHFSVDVMVGNYLNIMRSLVR